MRVLRGEQHPSDLAFILVVFEYLLTNQLPLSVTVRREPNHFGRPQSLANHPQLGRLVPTISWLRGIEPLGAQQDRRPALPRGNRILRFLQIQQMPFGGKYVAIAGPDGGPDVLRLAGFLGNDDLIRHERPELEVER